MNRFERVVQILDEAVGGPEVQIGIHRAFWRVPREAFVAKRVQGLPLVVVGNGAESNLVKALKGEAPFGADVSNPSEGAVFGRMPVGRPPVRGEDIAFIQRWIDEGCLEDPMPEPLTWRPTNATPVDSRYDDVFFLNPDLGWAVNSDSRILRTDDGGATWVEQLNVGAVHRNVYLRCVAFASESKGWVGTVTEGTQLFETSDGGATWSLVTNLPELAPSAVCGLAVVDDSVVYASGTNYPHPAFENRFPRMMKTTDGGVTWTAWDMTPHASLLVDTHFTDPDHGWVVGGKADPNVSPGDPGSYKRENVKPVVLYTADGGQTWENRVAGMEDEFAYGEWGWKIHFVNDVVGYISLENFNLGAILKTTDGGQTWARLVVNDPQHTANLEGIGFISEDVGWVGGWGSPDFKAGFSGGTSDGGRTWYDANEVGLFINRFRFLGDPVSVGYAAGRTVYKYSREAPPGALVQRATPATRFLDSNEPAETTRPVRLSIAVPAGASHLTVDVWDRFGEHLRSLVTESQPAAGARTVEWDLTDDAGHPLGTESFIVRVTVDGESESRILTVS